MPLPKPLAQVIDAARMAMPAFLAAAAAGADAAQLAVDPFLMSVLVGTGILTSVGDAINQRKEDQGRQQDTEFIRALCKQQGDWKRGL